jgi:hypothetical protein
MKGNNADVEMTFFGKKNYIRQLELLVEKTFCYE